MKKLKTDLRTLRVRVLALSSALMLAVGGLLTYPVELGQASQEERPDPGARSSIWYTVQKGDCLWHIAEEFNVSVELLADANKLGPDDILKENDELIIPEGEKIKYTVDKGDTLWDIAEKFNTTVEALASENGQGVLDKLVVNQEIVVPVEDNTFIRKSPPSDTEVFAKKLEAWPVTGTVSSGFGRRWGRMHEGIDIASEPSNPIRSVEDGIVVFAGDRGTYGNAVIINHGNGFRSLYAHASKLEVSAGERVTKGQVIARVGNTGRSTGPHLHFEMLFKGKPVNPENYLPTKM